jgi:hypothetical protein
MEEVLLNVLLALKPNIYKMEYVRTLVILDSMKMKNSILVNHVTKLVKNVQPELKSTVLNALKIST